jgi:hypothetical protein
MNGLTESVLWGLFKHSKQWLTNLQRASTERKTQSIEALRGVVLAARYTQTYIRQLKETEIQDHGEEASLSTVWTELGFKLADLGLSALAKRCDIKGRYWADSSQFDETFLNKADISLERMEQLARLTIGEIQR